MRPRRKFSPKVYAEVIERQGMICACGCKEALEVGLIDYDHEIALELGGKDEPANLRALIRRHHKAKTREDMRKIAKVRRIEKKGRIRNARDREIARILEKSACSLGRASGA